MKQKVNCDCSLCNNGIREERQYGAFEVKDDVFVIFDAMEWAYFTDWM